MTVSCVDYLDHLETQSNLIVIFNKTYLTRHSNPIRTE